MADALPKRASAQVIGKQVLRSGTSVAANYRSACRARSHADFISKMGIVLEEADETVFWLEMLKDSGLVKPSRLEELLTEANEIVAIAAASVLTSKRNRVK